MRGTKIKFGLTRLALRRALLTIVTGLCAAAATPARAEQGIVLGWNPSPNKQAVGYMLHYGQDGSNYTMAIDAGTNTSWNVTGLREGETNYFMVAAYNTNRVESEPSNQTVYYVPGVVKVEPRNAQHESANVNFPVAPGHTYKVQASADLVHWETVWQTKATANAWIQYKDAEAVNLKMRFYRTVSN